MNYIRQAKENDASRIAEIIVLNYRINFYPLFYNDQYYFGELNVVDIASKFSKKSKLLRNTFVYDDGIVKGIMCINGNEIEKLFVEPQFQSQGIGAKLLNYAVNKLHATWLWVLEYNIRGIAFYQKNGFELSNEKMIEDKWVPLVKMRIKTEECMYLRKVSSSSPDKHKIEEINNEAFQMKQRTSIDDLYSSDNGNLDIIGIYNKNVLVGFFTVRIHSEIRYIGYFAVAAKYRCKGMGSKALYLLKKYYPQSQFVVEIESPNDKCSDNILLQRRRDFYLRNGFFSTGWYLFYDDTELEILCSDVKFKKQEFEELTACIHSLYYDHIPKLYLKK